MSQNLPDYKSVMDPEKATLGGFEAVRSAGTYTHNGEARVIVQKTVVIPGNDARSGDHDMLIRTRAPELLLATLCSTLDPTTGICWSEKQPEQQRGRLRQHPLPPWASGPVPRCTAEHPSSRGGTADDAPPPAGPAPRSGPKGTWP